MQTFDRLAHFHLAPTAAPGVLLGSSGRLTLAAKVLGSARALAAVPAGPVRAQTGGAARTNAGFDLVAQLYEDGRWSDAFQAAAAQADVGGPCAAKLALLMLRHGTHLYGVGFSAHPRRVAGWATTVLQATVVMTSACTDPLPPSARLQRPTRSTSRRTASPNSITAIA